MTTRAIVEKECLYFIKKFALGDHNAKVYEELFERMSDKEFEEWLDAIDNDQEIPALYSPNLVEPSLSIKDNYKIAKELGFPLFQQLILTDPKTGQEYITPNKHLVGIVPVRRQVQMLEKKKSIPGSSSVVDERSGQAAGDAKGARLSAPEIQVNASKGLKKSMLELLKFRGGDSKAYAAMNRAIIDTGEASMDQITSTFDSTVKSNKTFSAYLKGMHLQNNLVE